MKNRFFTLLSFHVGPRSHSILLFFVSTNIFIYFIKISFFFEYPFLGFYTGSAVRLSYNIQRT